MFDSLDHGIARDNKPSEVMSFILRVLMVLVLAVALFGGVACLMIHLME